MDFAASSLYLASERAAYAPLLTFAAGAIGSFGPCTAPRLLVAAGITAAGPSARRRTLALIAGLVLTYACFGVLAGLLGEAVRFSSQAYACVAAVAFVAGCWILFAPARAARCCSSATTTGGAFLVGGAMAFIVSPCCTPLAFAIAGFASQTGDAAYAALLLAAFAVGHAAPLLALSVAGPGIARVLSRIGHAGAQSTVAAGMLFAMSAYFGFLA